MKKRRDIEEWVSGKREEKSTEGLLCSGKSDNTGGIHKTHFSQLGFYYYIASLVIKTDWKSSVPSFMDSSL